MLALFFQLKMMQSLQFIATLYDDLSEVTGKSAAPPPPFRQALTTMLTATTQAVVAEIDKSPNPSEFADLKTSLTDPNITAPVKRQIPSTQFEKVKQKTYQKLNKPYVEPAPAASSQNQTLEIDAYSGSATLVRNDAFHSAAPTMPIDYNTTGTQNLLDERVFFKLYYFKSDKSIELQICGGSSIDGPSDWMNIFYYNPTTKKWYVDPNKYTYMDYIWPINSYYKTEMTNRSFQFEVYDGVSRNKIWSNQADAHTFSYNSSINPFADYTSGINAGIEVEYDKPLLFKGPNEVTPLNNPFADREHVVIDNSPEIEIPPPSANTAPPVDEGPKYTGIDPATLSTWENQQGQGGDKFQIESGSSWNPGGLHGREEPPIVQKDGLCDSIEFCYQHHSNGDGVLKVYIIRGDAPKELLNTYYYIKVKNTFFAKVLNVGYYEYSTSPNGFPIECYIYDENGNLDVGNYAFTVQNDTSWPAVQTKDVDEITELRIPHTDQEGRTTTAVQDLHNLQMSIYYTDSNGVELRPYIRNPFGSLGRASEAPESAEPESSVTPIPDYYTYDWWSQNSSEGIVGNEMFNNSWEAADLLAGFSTEPVEDLPEKIKIVYYGPREDSNLYQDKFELVRVFDNTGSNRLLSEKAFIGGWYSTKNTRNYLVSELKDYEITFEAKEKETTDGVHRDYTFDQNLTNMRISIMWDSREIDPDVVTRYQLEPTVFELGVPTVVKGSNLTLASPGISRDWAGSSTILQFNNPTWPSPREQGLFCGSSMLSGIRTADQDISETLQIFRTKAHVGTAYEAEVLNFFVYDTANTAFTDNTGVFWNGYDNPYQKFLCSLEVDHFSKSLIRGTGQPVNLSKGLWSIKNVIYREDMTFFTDDADLTINGATFTSTPDNTTQDPANWGYGTFSEKMFEALSDGGDKFQLQTSDGLFNSPINFFMGSHVFNTRTVDGMMDELSSKNYNETYGWIDHQKPTGSYSQTNKPAKTLPTELIVKCQQLTEFAVKVSFMNTEKGILSEYVIFTEQPTGPPNVLVSNSNQTFKIDDTLEYEITFQSLNEYGAFNNSPDFLSLSVGHSQNVEQFTDLFANYPSLDFSDKVILQSTPTKVPGAMISQGLYKFKMNYGKIEYFLNVTKE